MWVMGNLSVNENTRNINIGVKKNNIGSVIAPFTVRCANQNQPYAFALAIYADQVALNDYFELFVTSPTGGDVVTLSDLYWLVDTR